MYQALAYGYACALYCLNKYVSHMYLDHEGPVDSITLPCVSVWSVTALDNGDVVVGCDDATARVFTREYRRLAPLGMCTALRLLSTR